jgi:hypothetical protein
VTPLVDTTRNRWQIKSSERNAKPRRKLMKRKNDDLPINEEIVHIDDDGSYLLAYFVMMVFVVNVSLVILAIDKSMLSTLLNLIVL